ncbi:MAG: YkoF family thiamine/hydroxymethylpyrimidine-binding protein [Anaerolineales bacterium]|jgi:uncharacterized protein YqgV (UPF0045/DUF77 family)
MTAISAQVSIYPLGKEELSPTINESLSIIRMHDLEVQPGPMSTLIYGDDESIFSALQTALRSACEHRQVVMVVTFSNACPVSVSEQENQDNLNVGMSRK